MTTDYGTIDFAEMMEESARLNSGGKGDYLDNFVLVPDNSFLLVRFLPPAKGKKFYAVTRIHRLNGRNIHCPRVLTTNKRGDKIWVDADKQHPCWACLFYSEEWKKSMEIKDEVAKKKQEDYARKWKANERYYYNCVVRAQKNRKTGEMEYNVGPKIFSVGKQVHQWIVDAICGNDKMGIKPLKNVADFKNGRDFKIVKKVKGGSYPEFAGSQFEPETGPTGTPEQIDGWMANLHDLDSLRVLKSSDEIKHELRKALGLVKDDSVTCDMSEFQKPQQTLEEQVRQQSGGVISGAADVTSVAVVEDNTSEETGMSEEDFIAQMQNM